MGTCSAGVKVSAIDVEVNSKLLKCLSVSFLLSIDKALSPCLSQQAWVYSASCKTSLYASLFDVQKTLLY